MRVLLIGDVHLADRPPSARTQDYRSDLFKKLFWCQQLVKRENLDAVLLLGDVFHSKVAVRTSHDLVSAFLRWIRSLDVPVLVVPGNHDLHGGSLQSLVGQPLGVVAQHPSVKILDGEFELDGLSGYAVPGVPLDQVRLPGAGTTYDLFVLHQVVTPPNRTFPGEHYRSVDVFDYARLFVFGHFHPYVAEWSVGRSRFLGVGALSRGSLHEHDLTRTPKVAILDTADLSLDVLDVPCRPASEVFRLREIRQKERRELDHDRFVESLKTVAVSSLTDERIRTLVDEAQVDQPVKEKALELLDRA